MIMRVAQRMITRNYMRGLNNSLSNRAETLERSASGLKFKKLSENVSDGTRAMRIQEERVRAEQQLNTVKSIQLEYNAIDSNLESIDDILQSVQEKLLMAMNDSYGQTKKDVLAQEVAGIKEQLLKFSNAQFGGKYLFSGTNNYEPPFRADSGTGKVLFNGIPLEDVYKDSGKFYYNATPGDPSTKTLVPDSGDIYMDVGLGLRMENGEPDPRTAFLVSISGIDMMGFGTGTTGSNGTAVAGNLYDLLTQVENAMLTDDADAMGDTHTQLVKLNDKMRMSRTELGVRANFLSRLEINMESNIDHLGELESNLISADPAEEAINMKMAEYVWLATLQLGNQILPTSLLDFLR